MSNKRHYFLVSARLLFQQDADSAWEEVYLNTTIASDQPQVIAKQIGRAQQGLQMLLFEKRGPVKVADVFIMAISKLGFMTEKEFIAGLEELEAEANGDAGNA
jgi:hypothetical protein